MRVAFQCDAFETLDPQTDTTLALMAEALERGFHVSAYTPPTLSWREGALTAFGPKISLQGKRLQASDPTPIPLEAMDVLWIRQDPPFDMTYLTPTYLLETLPPQTLLLNDPDGLRSAPEKLLITHFPELLPPTLITSEQEKAQAFLQEQGPLVLKPLYDYGGRSIFHVQTAADLRQRWHELCALYPQVPFLCQTFLPEVYEGDKRLFLIEGTYAGGYKKRPPPGEFRSNLCNGGQAVAYTPTPRDLEICESLGPLLRKKGLFFVGLDVIGPFLTEINVTSPTGLKAFNHLYHRKLEKKIWDRVVAQKQRGGDVLS